MIIFGFQIYFLEIGLSGVEKNSELNTDVESEKVIEKKTYRRKDFLKNPFFEKIYKL